MFRAVDQLASTIAISVIRCRLPSQIEWERRCTVDYCRALDDSTVVLPPSKGDGRPYRARLEKGSNLVALHYALLAKVLIHRYGFEANRPEDLRPDKRLYAAGLEAFTGQRFAGADRLKWPLQRLVHNLSRQELVNTNKQKSEINVQRDGQSPSDPASSSDAASGGDGAETEALGFRAHAEVDASVQAALAKFFAAELDGINGQDMCTAGFAALRELSSKWTLAKTLGLDKGAPKTWRRSRCSSHTVTTSQFAGPRHTRRLLTRVQRPRRPFTRREPQPTSSQQQSLSSPLVPHPENETEPSENRAEPAHHLADYSPAEDDATESTEERTGSYGWKWPAAWKSAAWVSRRAPLPGIDIAPTDAPAQGVYLISHPLLGFAPPNSIFHRSVVLLVDHTDTHSYGLIVNKDRDMTLREVCSPGAMPLALDEFSCFADSPVRVGGPVGNCFSWLHRHEEVGGVRFPDNTESPVYFCGQIERMVELVAKGISTPQDFSLFMGASSWDSEKLQQEIAAGDWIMATGPAELAMASRKNLWEDMLRAMGGEYAEMSRLPPFRRWMELGVENRPSDLQA